MNFRGFPGVLKNYWAPIALLVVVVSVFFGGAILGLYRKARTIPVVGPALPVK
jgi:Mg2+ and Co2+ transporter CorA